MPTHVLNIPFEQIRPLLPDDGPRITVWTGNKNQWPENPAGFQRDETLQLAFGRAIRARRSDHKHQYWMRPGISAGPGYLVLQGGWAAHKAVPVANDYFDGTFNAALGLSFAKGQLHCKVLSLDLKWNASLPAKLLDVTGLIRKLLLELVEARLTTMLNTHLQSALGKAQAELRRRIPQAEAILGATTLAVIPGALLLTFEYAEKAPPAMTASKRVMRNTAAKRVAGGAAVRRKAASDRAR